MTTIDRINQLSAERTRLYSRAGNGRRGDTALLQLIHDIDAELKDLWERRRQERAGRPEGIDLLVERSYEQAYGRSFDDAVAPVPVAGPADTRLATAA
jgi:hypothetical protein